MDTTSRIMKHGLTKYASRIVLLALLPLLAAGETLDLEAVRKDASKKGDYTPVSLEDSVAAEALFAQLFSGAFDCPSVKEACETLGFVLASYDTPQGTVHVLREAPGRYAGRGIYAFRPSGKEPWALEMPHSFKDLYTGTIGVRLFEEGPFVAAAWNTVKRDYEKDGREIDADVAHLPYSYLNAFTRAFARHYAGGWVIQPHGFARSKRDTPAGASADIIISAGFEGTPPFLVAMDGCIEGGIAKECRVFPLEVQELGATTNTQGQILREMGSHRFVHIEMAKDIREKMRDDATLREALLTCLRDHLK